MKKILFVLTFLCLMSASAWAGKAYPFPLTFIQSNGQSITVYLRGDEYYHWYTDLQGRILTRHGNDFTLSDKTPEQVAREYAEAHQNPPHTRGYLDHVPTLLSHKGKVHIPVILVEYQDKRFTLPDPKKSFEQYLNSMEDKLTNFGNGENRNYGSARKYFVNQSYGQFEPIFDLYGPVTLPHNMAYYGGASDNAKDEKHIELLKDACTLIDDSVNFTKYDQNHDGGVDLVYVIYAGYGQSNGAPTETMWPKRFFMPDSIKFDGMPLKQGGVSNELNGKGEPSKLINGLGLFVHEFSHTLGLPDFYPTTMLSDYNNQGMEDWSLMDNGEYVSAGRCPTAYTAWEREAMGWDSIPTITEPKQYKLENKQYHSAVKIVNPNNTNEYFVLQYFNNEGWNSRVAKARPNDPDNAGLLIYHVNYNNYAYSLLQNSVNNVQGKPNMTVIPADNLLLSSYDRQNKDKFQSELRGDLFGENAGTAMTSFSQSHNLPNASWRTPADDLPIYNINFKDNAVYFDFQKPIATTGITLQQGNDLEDNKIYTLQGIFVGTDIDRLPPGIYIKNKKKFVK